MSLLVGIGTLISEAMNTSIDSDSGSSLGSLNRTTLLSGLPSSDSYTSPFAALGGGLSLGLFLLSF